MKKRFLSWLLVLTMIVSLIPSTLVTAFAEEALAAPMAEKTRLELTNTWPSTSQVNGYDIIDIELSNTLMPGSPITVASGKTIIVHGSGTISGAGVELTDNAPIITVEDGGTLVLDGIKITSYVNGTNGAVYVKSGGLLDLGYNDQKARTAPGIIGNGSKNLVIADGATVRLNAEAKQSIGVSYDGDITKSAPISMIEGGRYTIQGNQDTSALDSVEKITADDSTNAKLVYSYDHVILRYKNVKVLFWDPTYSFGWSYRTDSNKEDDLVAKLFPYHQVGNKRNWFKDWANAEVTTVAKFSENDGKNWSTRKSFIDDENGKNLEQYDFIYIVPSIKYQNGNHIVDDDAYRQDEINALKQYLDEGGRIFIQCENGYFTYINQSATKLAQALGADFTITTDPILKVPVTSNTASKLITGNKTVATTWKVLNASKITYTENKQATWLFKETSTDKVFGVDLMAGSTTQGIPWGNITVLSDINIWNTNDNDPNCQAVAGKPFMINLIENTASNRATAAAGVNPNETIVPQAKVTTTEYRTVSAALLKITEGQTAVVQRYKTNTEFTPVENELLFEGSTVTDIFGRSIKAETSGVYIDMSSKMEFNVQSGTAKITPANTETYGAYTVYLGATLSQDKLSFDGGIKLSSTSSYTLCAEDADSPITKSNNGPASITIPTAGQSVTVTYPGSGQVTYTAKTDNEKFYLGKYTVLNAVSGNAQTNTTASHPHHGQTYTQTYTPATGYELKGGNFRVVMMNKEGSLSSVVVNMARSYADSVEGTKIVYKSEQTSYSDTYGSIGTVTVTENFTDGVCTSVDVKIEDVRSHIKIYTEGDASNKLAPTIILIGEGTDKNGQTVELYRFNTNMSYYDGQTVKSVKSIDWSKYALTGVKVAVAEADGSEGAYTDDTLKDINQTVNTDASQNLYCWVNLTKGNQYVKFTYEWNWVDVTVKAQYADGTEIPGASRVDEMEAGKAQNVIAPSVPGYEPDEASKTITPNANGTGNTVTFAYTQITDKITIVAQDEAGNTLSTVAGSTIAKGDAVSTEDKYAPALPGYTVKPGSGTASAGTYDGVNPVTVTYIYTAKEKAVHVKAYVYDTAKQDNKGDILKEDTTSYAKMTPGQTLSVKAPVIPGYKVKVDNANAELKEVKDVYITDDTNTSQEVCFFYEVDPNYNSNITVNLVDNNGKSLGGYTIPGVADQAQVVKAPTLHGYTVDVESVTAFTNKPNNTTTAGEVKFTYTKQVWTVTVELKDSSTTPATDITNKKPTGYPTTIEVIKGEKVAITAPSIYGYSLAENQAAVIEVTPTKDETVTFNYVPVDKSLVTITIIDKLDDGTGKTTDFMTRTETVAAGTTEKVISMLSIPGYKLTSAKIDGTEHITDVNSGSLKVTTTHATQGQTITVTLVHTYNKVNVTVEAKFNGKVLGSYTIPLDKDVQTQVFAPTVEGYTADATSKTFTPSDTNNKVEFTLTKNTGNVTIVVVDKDGGTELTRKDGGTVTKGDNISLTTIAGTGDANLPTIEFYKKSADAPVITVGSTTVTDGSAYDGTGDITVTYKYERKTQSITVVKKDLDTKTQIDTQVIADLPVGEEHTFTEVTVPSDYKAMDTNPTTYYVKDATGQQVIFWYQSAKADDYVSVTVKLINNDTNEVFQTYPVSNLRKGVATTITAPTPTGYTLASGQTQTKSVTPNGSADNDVVEFKYTITNPKTVTIKLLDTNTSTDLTAPTSYTTSYTLKAGDTLTITAPSISGYTLAGAAMTGGTINSNDVQVVTVRYEDLVTANTLTFSYVPVTQSNFVTHTVKFLDHQGTSFYSYTTMIAKSDTTTDYTRANVQYIIPGYKLTKINLTADGINTDNTYKVSAPNNKDATISYYFDEDSAKIIVEQYNGDPNNGGTKLSGDITLTGYRVGQTNIVVSAPARTDVALKDSLTKTVTGPMTATETVKFQYEALADIRFELYDAETGKLIAIKNATAGTTYKTTDANGLLDLSGDHYEFKAHTSASSEFQPNGAGEVTTPSSGTHVYKVYYEKQTRNVQFVPVDKAKLDEIGKTIENASETELENAKITGVTPAAMDVARLGETYKAVAQNFDGWTLSDQLSKSYTITAGTGDYKVYFQYVKKVTGTVEVHYHYGTDHNTSELLLSYVVQAAAGETATFKAPEYLENQKYKRTGDAEKEFVVTDSAAGHIIDFFYEANFWTVNTKSQIDGGTADEHEKYEVVKTTSTTLYPPVKAGYTLVGISGTGLTNGGADKLPTEWTAATNALTFTPSADTTVTYHYKTTSATEFQSTVTVEYKYNGYDLKASTTVQANKGQANAIDVPTFDGYTASTYTYKDGSNTTVTNSGVGNGISITPAEDTGTVTITYTRTDGSVVLPGKDGQIDAPAHDKDNVTVKPDGNTGSITGPDKDGNVTVDDDDGATVIRPTDPTNPDNGKDNIKVPDGTVIKPDGTIVLPDNGGEIGPDKPLPDNTPSGYITVTYKANGGVGEDVKQVVKVTDAKALANPFTHVSGAAFQKWSTQQNGVGGTDYTVGQTITVGANEKGITLYAQWGERIYTNSATLTYKPNGATGSDVTETVGSDSSTSFNAQLAVNPFTPPTGWTFGGWNEAANGSSTLYQAGATFAMTKDVNKTLYAQWYRVNSDGSITVPGKDGNPTTENDNVTANGNGTQNPTRDDTTGNITIPAGGSVTVGDKTIVVPDGAILKPDGTLEINKPDSNNNGNADDGKIEISLPNGTPTSKDDTGNADGKTVVTLTYQINNGENDEVKVYAVSGEKVKAIANPFTWDNSHFFLNWMLVGSSPMVEYSVAAEITVDNSDMELGAQWAKKNADGSVELPGKDGILEGNNGEEKDNVLVKPDGDNGNIAPQPDGSVKVEDNDGGTVTRPDPDDNTGDTKEDVKVPNGTIVKPDGTIVLPEPAPNGTEIDPDTKLPDGLPANSGYVVVTYEPNGGTGDVIQQVVKKDEAIHVLGADAFTAPAGKYFGKWSDGNAEYTANEELVPTQNVTLTAQWEQYGPAVRYTATVTFHDNTDGNNTATQTFGSVDSSSITAALNANTFTAPTGWSFMGWSTSQNGTADGTFYKNQASVTLNDGDTLDLYAIWYKQDGDNIVLPGVDGKAGTADDLTVKPGANGQAPTVKNDNGEGYVEAPTGSEIVKTPGDGSNTIKVITGPVNVYPDGTVKVPEGSKIELPDGTVVEGPATVDPGNTVDKDTDTGKSKRDNDGNIILPGKDGKMDAPNDQDNVKVTPDKDGNGTDNSTIDPDTGDVTLPDGGKVTYPDKTEVEAPDGSIVHPDGSIEFPDTDEAGSIKPDGGTETPIPGGSKIDADGVVTYRYTIKFSGVSRADEYVMVKAGTSGTYTAPHFNNYTVDKQSATWTGGNQPFTITFTYTKGSTGGNTGGGGGGGGTVSYTITASAGNGGSITPSGKVSVSSGNDKAFIITADNGYRIKDVLVDGKSVGAVSAYAFEKVKANHTISVTFEAAKPASGENVADPDETGVSGWLRVTDHSAYMNGYGNGKFGPNDTLTRAQAAQLFYNLLVNKNVEITVSFTDVPEDAWCAIAVNTLASLGIVNGIGDGKFDPNSNITRGQFAAIATRFAKAVSGVTESPFSDVSSSDWYFSSVVTAVSYGWIQGYSDGTFGPQDNITRAQAATIVNRMLARSADRDFVNAHSDLVKFTDVNVNDWFYYQVMEAANGHSHGYNVDGYEIWTGIQK